jgi:hypothetical protein
MNHYLSIILINFLVQLTNMHRYPTIILIIFRVQLYRYPLINKFYC